MAGRKWWQLGGGYSYRNTTKGPIVWLGNGPQHRLTLQIGDEVKTAPDGQFFIVAVDAPIVGSWTEVAPPV